eukprot:TRINITY_DN8613_c0_g1_i2.p1 TRINITY_DN8613_c0_g1~~TRINITY_DN8613_c0_g1_i2.p1  ORF type:complete len:483 (+),score=87.85 TRINITY_DN8613_c0_g1_i2:18-1466(+)
MNRTMQDPSGPLKDFLHNQDLQFLIDFKTNMNSEVGFEKFLKSSGEVFQRVMRDFMIAVQNTKQSINLAEIVDSFIKQKKNDLANELIREEETEKSTKPSSKQKQQVQPVGQQKKQAQSYSKQKQQVQSVSQQPVGQQKKLEQASTKSAKQVQSLAEQKQQAQSLSQQEQAQSSAQQEQAPSSTKQKQQAQSSTQQEQAPSSTKQEKGKPEPPAKQEQAQTSNKQKSQTVEEQLTLLYLMQQEFSKLIKKVDVLDMKIDKIDDRVNKIDDRVRSLDIKLDMAMQLIGHSYELALIPVIHSIVEKQLQLKIPADVQVKRKLISGFKEIFPRLKNISLEFDQLRNMLPESQQKNLQLDTPSLELDLYGEWEDSIIVIEATSSNLFLDWEILEDFINQRKVEGQDAQMLIFKLLQLERQVVYVKSANQKALYAGLISPSFSRRTGEAPSDILKKLFGYPIISEALATLYSLFLQGRFTLLQSSLY